MSGVSKGVVMAIEKAFQKNPGDTVKIARELEKTLGVSREVADQMVLKQPQLLKDQQVRIMVDEMEINPGMARQVADGEMTLSAAQTRSANQGRKLGAGKEQGVMDDNAVVSAVHGADPDGVRRFEAKQKLSPEQKAALTNAEIAYKKGDPKPLANAYKAILPIAGIGGSTAALANPEIQDSGMASAPRSETLGSVTMGLRDLERRVEGSPAEWLFPSGMTDYLETVNRRTEDPNAQTRMFAALDVMP